MYLGPLFVGMFAGYANGAYAFFVTGSGWTAFLAVVLIGSWVTFALLARLYFCNSRIAGGATARMPRRGRIDACI
jgi:hypothetical protein